MTLEEIKTGKKEIEAKYGMWTADNIRLADGVFTMNPQKEKDKPKDQTRQAMLHSTVYDQRDSSHALRIKRMLQIIADNTNKPFEELRILDLACLEGGFSIELAMRGATITAVEGREANIAKGKFAKEVLGLQKLTFILDDVLNVNKEKHGHFDIVLCLGILYHLDEPDVFRFLENIGNMTEILIVDTLVYSKPESSCSYKNRTYWGGIMKDHEPDESQEAKLKNLWMSLNNVNSFVPTRFSLVNFLQQLHFSSIYECLAPVLLGFGTRTTFVAKRGTAITSLLSTTIPDPDLVEYSEINSGKSDSELHLLNNEIMMLRNHPAMKLFLPVFRVLKKLKK